MSNIQLTITHIHSRGFAFAISDTGEQCFVPPHVIDDHEIERGDIVRAQVVLNPNEEQRRNTKWCAVNIIRDEVKQEVSPAAKPAAAPTPRSIEELDEEVFSIIQDDVLATTAIIAEAVGIDTTTAGNSAYRLFNSGRIAKADVYSRVGLQRPSFILWATKASHFLEAE